MGRTGTGTSWSRSRPATRTVKELLLDTTLLGLVVVRWAVCAQACKAVDYAITSRGNAPSSLHLLQSYSKVNATMKASFSRLTSPLYMVKGWLWSTTLH